MFNSPLKKLKIKGEEQKACSKYAMKLMKKVFLKKYLSLSECVCFL